MRTIVLDAGAFVAAERNDRRLAAALRVAYRHRATVLAPATVIAEVWRDPPHHQNAALLEMIDTIVSLDLPRAKSVGVLLGLGRSAQVSDACVALLAAATQPSLVLTSDPSDIAKLVRSLGFACSVDGRGSNDAPVKIETI